MIYIDQEFQALIPPLSAEEKQQLEANIVSDGCRDPLVVWGDTLIDGHNRYEICTRLGIEFDCVEKDFDSREDVIVWMVDNQRGRRNLNDFQRTELQLKKKSAIASKAKANSVASGERFGKGLQNSAEPIKAIDTRLEIAEAAGVSHDTVSKVERIQETAGPELVAALRESKVSINAAADVATLPKQKQAEIVARGTKEILQAAKQIRAERSEERRNERLEKIVSISTGNAPVGSIAERYPDGYTDDAAIARADKACYFDSQGEADRLAMQENQA